MLIYPLEPEVLTASARFLSALILSLCFFRWHFNKSEHPEVPPQEVVPPVLESEFFEQELSAAESSDGRIIVDHFRNVNGVKTNMSWVEERLP